MDGLKPRLPAKKARLTLPQTMAPPLSTKPISTGLELGKKKRPLQWLWITAGAALLLALGALGAFAWYSDALQPRSPDGTKATIKVEPGASIEQIGQELEQLGVIKSSLAFGVYVKLSGNPNLKAGTYLFAPNQAVPEIVEWLQNGKVSTRKVTILPGKTIKQIRESLVKGGFGEQAVDAALQKKYDHPLLADKPAGATLEGYIFPETYFVEIGTSPEDLLVRSFDEFEKRLNAKGLRAKLAARGFSLFQGITLASIVEMEVSNTADQRQVAQVFGTRLARGMRLGSDPTYKYAASMLGVEPSVSIDSPYNTRLYSGLPPGPIANFNLGALEAVAEPAAGDYLYFVSGDDGTTHFSHTFEEHEQNIARFCTTLCQRP